MLTIEFQDKTYLIEHGVNQVMPAGAINPETLSNREQTELYNLLNSNLGVDGRIKKFSDGKTGARRVIAKLRDWAALDDEAKEQPEPEAKDDEEVAGPSPDKTGERETGSKVINFLGMRQDIKASEEIIPLKRKSSIRAQALAVLTRGATEAQLVEVFNNADKRREYSGKDPIRRSYEMVRIFCYYYGWGTQSSKDGKTIKLVGVVSSDA